MYSQVKHTWKHSQYFLRQADFLQWQPDWCWPMTALGGGLPLTADRGMTATATSLMAMRGLWGGERRQLLIVATITRNSCIDTRPLQIHVESLT